MSLYFKVISGNIARILFSFSLLLSACFHAYGQSKHFIHFTEDDGLPGNIVMDVVRDDSGFIWIATMNGIAKFDGNRFIPINDSNGNPINMAWALAAGEANEIYAATFGAGIFMISGDSVSRIIHAPEKKQDRFRKLYYSRFHKMLIAGSNHGLFIMKDSLIRIPFKEKSTAKSEVLSFASFDSLIFFTVADEGLYRLKIDRSAPERSFAEKVSNGFAYACLVSGNNLYSGSFDSVFVQNLHSTYQKQFLSLVKKQMLIWNMTPFRDGKFYIGGLGDERYSGGALLYDPAERSYTAVTDEAGEESVNSVFHDSIAGVTWIARDNGLSAFFDSPFSSIPVEQGDYIKSTGCSGDSLFILTGTEISYLKKGKIIPWLSNEQVMEKINYHYRKFPQVISVYDNRFNPDPVILVQNDSRLFVSSQRGALSVPDLKLFMPLAVGTFRVSPDAISAHAFIKYSDLRFYPSIKNPSIFTTPEGPGGRVRDISEILESGGSLYCISSLAGLYAIKDNRVFRLTEENSVIEDNLSDADKDKAGNIWFLSAKGKLFQVLLSEDSLNVKKSIDLTKAGISGNSFKWMKFHGSWLIIGTNKGLYVIKKESLDSDMPRVSNFYNGSNGYDCISAENPVTTSDGKLYVNTRTRIICIDTTFQEVPAPHIYLSGLNLNGKNRPMEFLEKRNLDFNHKQISFRFDAIKYPLSKNIRYRYKLNNGDWVSGNHVELQSPRPGKYEITMECINSENMFPVSRVMHFSVMPPFWHSAWFILVMAGTLMLLVFTFIRFRIDGIKKQHEEKAVILKKNAELQLRSLQIQMNPHFIFNTLNAIQGFIITNETEESLTYLSKLATIIRSNLENACEEYIYLVDEIIFLQKYISIESMRFGESLAIQLKNNVSEGNVMLPPMLIQPLIENAIHYGMRDGRDGKITITVDSTEKQLSVTVEDNGPGMEATKNEDKTEHTGRALKIISQRLSILNHMNHNGLNGIDFMDVNDDGKVTGTRVVVRLELRKG